ncbi:Bug family tripartite tricarboxylate transporter substrate binding protein [Parendozoicomonas haliclonae]|uniref:Tripartite tricarboxylate transporter family receptor n=1 Tax=Parendozoicomonas haliclonae TaxID=1960125 RepID=A0A1X7AR73_9GAMM|nr:tripartite tricarboxylate transporter substrate binding protein [Parendozoicomonas haliclonae]SMA50814.1 Tripartite tricarboxylate transporter family receptor [Parendozoicomonas haliclonae]
MKKSLKAIAGVVALSLGSSLAMAADYPARNIRMIVPFGAGGGTDSVARALAEYTEPHLGQPIAIMNRTGGAGAVGMTAGANSRADGYTITMITREIVSLPKLGLMQVDSEAFKMVRLVNFDPALVTVKADSPYKTMGDIIEKAKANPGSVKFASTAKPNFYALAIERNQDVTFNQIPFNGAAEASTAVMGGHVEFTITGPGEVKSQVESGQLRPLAVMAEKRLASMPEVPTMKELGFDVVSGTWRGIAVPKKTPDEIVAKLESAIGKAVADKDFVAFMEKGNFFIEDKSAAEFTKFIGEDTKSLMPIIEKL